VNGDIFEENDTADQATQLGTLGSSPDQLTNLTINLKPTGFFDQDWYEITAGLSGTLTASMTNIQFNGNGGLQLRVFGRNPNNTLTELSPNTGTVLNANTETVTTAVTAGQQYFAWVEGFNFCTGTYDLTLGIE
jgi:hypothetical protein